MKLTQIVTAAIISLALLSLNSANAQTGTITAWTFENTGTTTNNSPPPSTGTGTADAIGMTNTYHLADGSQSSTNTDDVLKGKTSDTGSNTLADTTQEWRVRGQNPGNGWSISAPIATQGAQFFASTAANTTGAIHISFDFYVTNQSEAEMEVLYTTNGGSSWNNLPLNLGSNSSTYIQSETGSATDTLTTSGSYVLVSGAQDWFQGLNATITDPNALGDAGFGFEVVNASTGTDVTAASGGAYNNSSGNWRFDNVVISDIASTPEPTSWSLGIIAMLALAGYSLRRKSRA